MSSSEAPPAPDVLLRDDDVTHDLAVVLDVIEHEDAARPFVTPETAASLRARLGEITRREHTAASFCDALGSALTTLLDPGLYASLDVDAARACLGSEGTSGGIRYGGTHAGEGLAGGARHRLEVREADAESGGPEVVVLGVGRLAPAGDPGWVGLDASLARVLAASAVVIDLRGARGADVSALAPLVGAFGADPSLASVVASTGPRTAAMRATASQWGLGDPPSVTPALEAWVQPIAAPAGPDAPPKRDVYVLLDEGCEEGCELLARGLETRADAEVLGAVGWRHRLSSGDPGVLVLPHTHVRLVVPLRAVTVAGDIGRATGDRGAWFERRGYGGEEPRQGEDLLPFAVSAVRERAAHRARVARRVEEPLPLCAEIPRAESLDALAPAQRGRLHVAGAPDGPRRAVLRVELPVAMARTLIEGCPGLHVQGAHPLGPPGLDEAGIWIAFDDLLDLSRLFALEAVRDVSLEGPPDEHPLTE